MDISNIKMHMKKTEKTAEKRQIELDSLNNREDDSSNQSTSFAIDYW